MARKKISGIAVRESGGDVLVYDNADVTVYIGGTATEITVYETELGSGTDITTGDNGYFEFWIPFDITSSRINIEITKTGYSDLVEDFYPAFPQDRFLANNSNIPGDSIYDALENLTKKYKYFAPDFDASYDGYPASSISSGGGAERLQFWFPDDMHTVISIKIRLVSGNADASTDIDLETAYGGVGEDPLENTNSDTGSTYDLPYDAFHDIDVSSLFSDAEAGDSGRITVQNNEAWTIYLFGLILNYSSYPGN
jgi:hypothetical protein